MPRPRTHAPPRTAGALYYADGTPISEARVEPIAGPLEMAKGRAVMNEELSPDVLAELHTALEQTRTQLRADLQALRTDETTQGREDTQESRAEEVGDSGDEGADLEQLERDHAQADVLRRRLAEVQHALGKFAHGTYGMCEVCGKPIPLARLRILPEARYDVQHQAEIDARTTGPAH